MSQIVYIISGTHYTTTEASESRASTFPYIQSFRQQRSCPLGTGYLDPSRSFPWNELRTWTKELSTNQLFIYLYFCKTLSSGDWDDPRFRLPVVPRVTALLCSRKRPAPCRSPVTSTGATVTWGTPTGDELKVRADNVKLDLDGPT
jgi:hypothetical protein